MSRYTQQDQYTVGGLNAENKSIAQAIADTLSRKGDTPNAMETDLDMNSNRVLNIVDAQTDSEPTTLRQFRELIPQNFDKDQYITPEAFGAVGDGVTDDTQALKNCFAASKIVLIDKKYRFIENLVCDKYITCVNEGELIYDGPQGTSANKPLTITAKFFGDVFISGSEKSVLLLTLDPDGSEQHGGKVVVKDLRASDSVQSTSAGCVTGSGKISLQSVHVENFVNTGHINDSLPQGLVPLSGSTIVVNQIYGKNCESLLVTPANTETYVDLITCIGVEDNGIYNLGGKVVFGTMTWVAGSQDEPIVNRGYLYGNLLVVEGISSACFNVEDAEYTEIRQIVSRPKQGTDMADPDAVRSNLPNQLWYHRSGNTANGPIKLGSVTGDFAVSIIRTGFNSGTTEYFSVEEMNINLWYEEADTDWNRGNIFELRGIEQFDIGKVDLRIIDAKGTIDFEGVERIFNSWWTPVKFSTIDCFDVTFQNLNGSFTNTGTNAANFRGQRQSENLVIKNGVWQTNIGPYLREQRPERFVNNIFLAGVTPTAGYWHQGQTFDNVNSTQIQYFKCIASGTPGTWYTVTI